MCWGIWFLVAGSVYNLSNFFGSRNKDQYRVADHVATVSFSWNSSLSVLENPSVLIPEDRFRFHSYEDLRPTVTPRVIFMIMLPIWSWWMDGRTITDHMILDKVDIAEKRIYVFMFRHMKVMKLLSVGQGCSRLLQEIQVVWKHPKRSFGHHCEPSLYISEPSKDYLDGWVPTPKLLIGLLLRLSLSLRQWLLKSYSLTSSKKLLSKQMCVQRSL